MTLSPDLAENIVT